MWRRPSGDRLSAAAPTRRRRAHRQGQGATARPAGGASYVWTAERTTPTVDASRCERIGALHAHRDTDHSLTSVPSAFASASATAASSCSSSSATVMPPTVPSSAFSTCARACSRVPFLHALVKASSHGAAAHVLLVHRRLALRKSADTLADARDEDESAGTTCSHRQPRVHDRLPKQPNWGDRAPSLTQERWPQTRTIAFSVRCWRSEA